MSAIEIATSRLTANPGVTAITTKSRIFPFGAKQGAAAPYLTINRVGAIDEQLLNGAGEYRRDRIDVCCIALTGTEAESLGDAVIAAFRNVIKATIGAFVDVDIMFADVDVTSPNDERSAFQRDLQFFIRWRI